MIGPKSPEAIGKPPVVPAGTKCSYQKGTRIYLAPKPYRRDHKGRSESSLFNYFSAAQDAVANSQRRSEVIDFDRNLSSAADTGDSGLSAFRQEEHCHAAVAVRHDAGHLLSHRRVAFNCRYEDRIAVAAGQFHGNRCRYLAAVGHRYELDCQRVGCLGVNHRHIDVRVTHRAAHSRSIGLVVGDLVARHVVLGAFHVVTCEGLDDVAVLVLVGDRQLVVLDQFIVFVLRYLQLTELRRDVVVARLCIGRHGVGKGVVRFTLRRPASGDGDVHAFACDESIAAYGDFFVGQRGSVEDLLGTAARQGNVALGDLQRAVLNNELNVLEVRVRVHEVARLHLGPVGSRVPGLQFGAAVEGEVSCLVQFIVDLYVVAADILLGSVVLIGSVLRGDGNDDGILRQDRQGGRYIGDGIVALCFIAGRVDRVLTDVFAGHAAQFVLDQACALARCHAGHCRRQSGIRRAEDLSLVRRRDRHRPRLDRQRSGNQLDIVVLRDILAGCHGCCNRVGTDVLAGFTRLGSRDIIAAFQADRCRGQGRLIVAIDHGLVVSRDRDLLGIDCQCAIDDDEGHIREVRVDVRKVSRRQVHIICTRVDTAYAVVAAEDEVGYLIELVTDRCVVAGHGMLGRVVRHCIAVLCNGHRHINRIDRLVAVRHVEGHSCEVRVGVYELLCRQVHVRGARIRPGRRRCTVEGEVLRHVIQSGIRGRGVAAHAVLFAVVVRRVVRTADGYHSVDRGDRLVAVRYVEGDTLEVAVRVRELATCQVHVRGARIRPGRRCCTAEGEVLRHVIQVGVCSRGVAAHAVLFAVIVRRVVRAADSYHSVDLLDLLVAVRHVEGHGCEVRVRIRELISRQAHVRGARIRPGRRCCAAEGEVLRHVIQAGVCSRGVTAYAVLFAVIVRRVVRAGDGYCCVDRSDRLVAIRHIEGHLREVAIRVRELLCRQAHGCGTCVSLCSLSCAAEGEIALLI